MLVQLPNSVVPNTAICLCQPGLVMQLGIENLESNGQNTETKLNSVALVRERTIPTKRPLPVGEVSANFFG